MPPLWEGQQGALVALLLLLLLPAVAAQTGLQEEEGTTFLGRSRAIIDERFLLMKAERERTVDCSVACTHRARGPVCGTNGRTYRSLCDLDLDICRKVKVSLKHDGECTLAEKCLDERRAREEEIKNGELVHVPNCLEDGSYAPIQCHNYTRFCWCSSLDGIPIQETVQSGSLPTCPVRHPKVPRTTSSSAATERCTGRSRRTFTARVSRNMMKEFKRERNTQRFSERKLLKRTIKWKFSKLDLNKDKVLQRREYKQLRRTVRKFIKPKKCAKMFPRMCDVNGDRILTLREWISCFTRKGPKNEKRNRNKKRERKTSKPSGPSCEHERSKHGIVEGDHSNMSIPVYKCQANGKYEPMQCFKGNTDVICICVDEWTGNSLDGTGVMNGTPNCSRPMPHARVWPDCEGEIKTRFMRDLQKFLIKRKEGGDRNAGTTHSAWEFAARYHFESLDADSNNFLEGREKQTVKRFFKSNPKLKRCGRKMIGYCDVNYDKRVSLEEWVACVTMLQNDTVQVLPPPDPDNPFVNILKSEV